MSLPELPPRIQDSKDLEEYSRVFYSWFQEKFKQFMNTNLHTIQDFKIITKGKGVILTNAAGTVTKRVRLNNAGDGIIIEDV